MRGNVKKIYTCPMHPEVIFKHEGMCPECGMRLVPSEKKEGHGTQDDFDTHKGHSTNIFKIRFWVSLFLSLPIVAYSDIAQKFLGFETLVFPGSAYAVLVLASIIYFYGGGIFITSAYRELNARLPGMMTLIALAISVAYFYSVGVTFFGGGETLFWELATLITIMLLGHWIEMRAVSGAQGALKELSKLLPDEAEVLKNGETKIVMLSELKKGDFVLVRPGSRVPADGVVSEGVSDVDESIATGESRPVPKKEGSGVIAGTTNGDGSLRVVVTKIGSETFLAGVMRLVAEAQSSKSRLQILSDRAAYYLTIVAVSIGGMTFVSWIAAGDVAFAINRMVAVLVIACPHALGLAIPLVASISTTKAARNGFLVRERLALEAARNVDVVLFDKTGTLTRGEFGVDTILSTLGSTETKVLELAASVNSHSEHSLAKAIVHEAKARNIALVGVSAFERLAGKGAQAKVGGDVVRVGNEALLQELGVLFSTEHKSKVRELMKQGKTVVHVVQEKTFIGSIALSDIIRPESKKALQDLKKLGVTVAMITGDSEDVAAWVSKELGVDQYFASVLPGQKADKVKVLQKEGAKVAMVGDGVNDAPALMQADLGIAIGAGTNVAIESAGIILVRNDPRDIAKVIRLSKFTYSKMLQNLFWATGYNVVAIPLAAGVLAFQGIFLEPALAAVFMSLSTVIVAFNAVLLRTKKL